MFYFKHFSISDDHCSMKVGTDGVLLGAWAEVASSTRLLDVGTGSGLIALMCAQRSHAAITAVEIDEAAAREAKENVQRSPFGRRITVVTTDFASFASAEPFDCIVSNPPFFTESLLPPDAQRATARHTDALNFSVLCRRASALLQPRGLFQLILPYDVAPQMIALCDDAGLALSHHTAVVTREGKAPRRSLLRFIKTAKGEPLPSPTLDTFAIYDNEQQRTEAYREMTKDFYIR